MPKFEVIVIRKVEYTLSFEIAAKDEDIAHKRVEKIIEDCAYEPDAIAKRAKAQWEEVDDTIEIDEVQQYE